MPTSSNVPDVPQAERLRAVDRLEYVADLLLELQSIAISSKCETLAGLLEKEGKTIELTDKTLDVIEKA